MLEIEKVKKKKFYYDVFFTNGEKITVLEDQIVRYRLLKGREISSEQRQAIVKETNQTLGLQFAYHYLSYQLRSEKEVFLYLKQKEVSLSDRKKIIQKLKDLSLIDDTVYAKSYVRTQMKEGTKGPTVLSQTLKEKGISLENIEEALKEYSNETQYQNIEKLVCHYMKRPQKVAHKQKIKKATTYLRQKGFSLPLILKAIETLAIPDEKEKELFVALGKEAFRKYQKEEGYKKKQKIAGFLYRKGFSLDDIYPFIENYKEKEE